MTIITICSGHGAGATISSGRHDCHESVYTDSRAEDGGKYWTRKTKPKNGSPAQWRVVPVTGYPDTKSWESMDWQNATPVPHPGFDRPNRLIV